MSDKIKVRVVSEKGGFIYGRLRLNGAVFTLKSIEHSTDIDGDGEPVVISAEQQFSSRWMERIDSNEKVEVIESDDPKVPSGMKKTELVEALNKAGVEFPNGLSKKELVVLLEDHQSEDEE